MHHRRTIASAIVSVIAAAALHSQAPGKPAPALDELRRMTARFAPTPLRGTVSRLSGGDRGALVKLIDAARIVNRLYMQQLWSRDTTMYSTLRRDSSALGLARLHYFWINKSPWSEIDGYTAFLPDVPPRKLPGANYYPEDMSKDEFERWVATLPPEEKEQAVGFFTVVRRRANRKLRLVPYSRAFEPDLRRAAALLRQAAALTTNASLSRFLLARADAFGSNDYYESDLAWMDLDAPVDITIGPYETYTDELFGYKAAFEAYVNVRDDSASARLAFLGAHLQEIEDHLPEDPQYRTRKLGALAPIRVVDELFAAGDGSHGIQTAAYNLPNDDRVVQQKGAKRVMLQNVQQAKFIATLVPISKRVLPAAAVGDVRFDLFVTHIVAHELTHGLGPHQITVGGRSTNPRLELKELYAAIEEAKADVTGLFALQYLMTEADAGRIRAPLPHGAAAERRLYTTYLASAFRTLRFGLQDAHARGMAVQLNYLLDHGGYRVNSDGTFGVDFGQIKEAVRSLDHEFLTIEATGDYAAAKRLLDGLGVMRPETRRALDRLENIPTDIEPIFVTADSLTNERALPPGGRKRSGSQ